MYMTLVVVYVCSMYISQKWDPSQSHEEKKLNMIYFTLPGKCDKYMK